jgi:dCTP diphosphatase
VSGGHGILAAVSDLEAIRDAARAFREERDWEQFQDPKSVLLALVGEVGELAELLQWLPADRARELIAKEPLQTRVAEELGDVLVYLVGLAEQCGVDLGPSALAKIEASSRKYPVESHRGVAPDRIGSPTPVRPSG